MFKSLPHIFRDHNLSADVRTLMLLRKSIERGLVNTPGDLYLVLKGLVTTSPKDYGPFTSAFYQYFLDIEIRPNESLDSAILRSDTFRQWKDDRLQEVPDEATPDVQELVDQFLNEVHLSTYDIQKVLAGEDIVQKDDPDQVDKASEEETPMPERLDQMADYSSLSLEELLKRMEAVARQQRADHKGGSHWIGQGGVSPFGSLGAAKGGIRAGGAGGGKLARRVAGDRNFYPVDKHKILQDDNIDVALSCLKGIEEESVELRLDVPQTIKEGVKQGGLFLPHLKEKIDQKVQVVLLIDNGGWSMTPYIHAVTRLFSKMNRRFAHDLKTYYYHNTIYGGAYSNAARTRFVPIEQLLNLDKNYSVFVIGDADMAPYELSGSSVENWQSLQARFGRMVWLNPMHKRYWPGSFTLNLLRNIIPMHSLSPSGIEKAIEEMNRKRRYNKG